MTDDTTRGEQGPPRADAAGLTAGVSRRARTIRAPAFGAARAGATLSSLARCRGVLDGFARRVTERTLLSYRNRTGLADDVN